MKFFISGEVDVLIQDAWRSVARRVEDQLNERCQGQSYGEAIEKIAIIPIILRPEWQAGRTERRLIQHKQGAADYRTFIDFKKFRAGNDIVRELLLLKNIVEAISDITRKLGKAVAGEALVNDVMMASGYTREQIERA